MKNISIFLIIGVAVIIAAVMFMNNPQEDANQRISQQEERTLQREADNGESEQEGSGFYEPYSPEKIRFAEEGNVILFFKAQWCSTCSVLDKNITENINDIPEDVKVLLVDYDTETELRKKYGVTFQHTLVQVDAEGDMIKKWSGGLTLDSILAQI